MPICVKASTPGIWRSQLNIVDVKTKDIIQTFLIDVVSAKPPIDDGAPTKDDEPLQEMKTLTRAQLAKLRYKKQQEAAASAATTTDAAATSKPKPPEKLDISKLNENEKKQL